MEIDSYLPRENVSYDYIWTKKLKDYFTTFDFIDKSQRGCNTNILRLPDCLEYYNPKIVIIQIGIVDCAPRLLYNYEEKIVRILPRYINRIYLKLSKIFRRSSARKAYVKPEVFKLNFENYFQRALLSKIEVIYVFKIMRAGSKYTKLNNKVQEAIIRYNKIIDELAEKYGIVKVIDVLSENEEVDKITIEDGYHINYKGHEIVANKLISLIKNYLYDNY